jgi:hypothetical protein
MSDWIKDGAIRAIIVSIVVCVGCLASVFSHADTEISGDYYDWQKTLQPEKPWHWDYSKTLVMKIYLCDRDVEGKPGILYLKFDQALEVIRKLDNLTLGMSKIVYLVGWQFTGHDSGYPAWSVVNERLKRPQDATAVDSLKWLMTNAWQYHTAVSLHINMMDAYKDSPLWKTYDENNIILKEKNGSPIQGDIGGVPGYGVSYAQEWKLGFAQKRIDGLLRMLPQLQDAATIHIDAFHSITPMQLDAVAPPIRPDWHSSVTPEQLGHLVSDPLLGYTVDDEVAAQRKIFRYWRMRGMDVTAEIDAEPWRKEPFIGLQPMAWWFYDLLQQREWFGKPRDFKGLPPSLYIGTPMHAEEEIKADPVHLTGLTQQFCTKVVPWYYHNNPPAKADDLGSTSDEGDIFLPAAWRSSTWVACSGKGYTSKNWRLPQAWAGTSKVRVTQITPDGLKPLKVVPVKNGAISLGLKAHQVVAIERQQ